MTKWQQPDSPWKQVAWLKKKFKHLQAKVKTEASTRYHVCVSSPLTKYKEWANSSSSEDRNWKHFEVFCPCCKRPLDVTVTREEKPGGDWELGESYCSVADGSWLQCTRNLAVFESPTSWQVIRHLSVGETTVAAGPPTVMYYGAVVPVRPRGVVDGKHVQKIADRTQAATAPYLPTSPLRLAYCAAIWGANAGYALGACVLGARLQELSESGGSDGGSSKPRGALPPERVLLHTDDVPPNFLQVLGKVWTLRQVDYIDGVESLYSCKGTVHDGVFTKLAAWGLTAYDRVLLLDIDLVILKDPLELFDLEPPAALVRGDSDQVHGSAISGRRWFRGEDDYQYPWHQGGGINAGVILLQPCEDTLARMIAEVTCEGHPEHMRGNGPEQDYLTRFFASAPWHAMDVRWNFQVHHLPFALERFLQRYRYKLDQKGGHQEVELDRAWLPVRLRIDLETVGIVHFSGEVKPWHLILDAVQDHAQSRAVKHAPSSWNNDLEGFADHLLVSCCEGHKRWLARTASADEYAPFGVELSSDGHFHLLSVATDETTGNEADATVEGDLCSKPHQRRLFDVTEVVDAAVKRLKDTTISALTTWRQSAYRFLEAVPEAAEELQRPAAPSKDSFAPSVAVEVLWPPNALPNGAGQGGGKWLPATVVSVHADERHVVRFDHDGSWGDTERGVLRARLRLGAKTTIALSKNFSGAAHAGPLIGAAVMM